MDVSAKPSALCAMTVWLGLRLAAGAWVGAGLTQATNEGTLAMRMARMPIVA